ncbi:sulfite efflux pump SSU1 [Leptodontidium sp. MPI-SDFR-AT-0119]|nr:sulfite efflux pump SSU1 [Leptodontidium sp. MPI-SDFR-AT-0119]
MSTSITQEPQRPSPAKPLPATIKSRSRRIVRNFTPSWFAITMGTGIIAVLLFRLPYNGKWLYELSIIIFVFDLILFVLFCLISALRYLLYPEIWSAMLNHPTESLFLGTCPMGLGILIQMIVNVCVPAWGSWAVTLAWTLWWIEIVLSVAICFYLPYMLMSVHKTDIASVTTFWLLPIVGVVIAAATGGTVAGVLPNPTHALWTLIVSYILWGIGVPLALFTLVLYYHRLTMHKLPPPAVISSVFLPLGPLGEGGFGIMKIGEVALTVFPATNTIIPSAGQIVHVFGFLTGLLMWGFGLAWLFWALASFSRSKSPFNMGWWSIVFATGVFTGSTITLGQEMPSRFFDVLGTVFTVIVILFWMVTSAYTIRGTISGDLFFSPAIVDLPDTVEMSTMEP